MNEIRRYIYWLKNIYHRVSAVNSGWKAVPSKFPCFTATITFFSDPAFSWNTNQKEINRKIMSELSHILGINSHFQGHIVYYFMLAKRRSSYFQTKWLHLVMPQRLQRLFTKAHWIRSWFSLQILVTGNCTQYIWSQDQNSLNISRVTNCWEPHPRTETGLFLLV